MALYFGDKKIGRIGITNGIGLDTSDADITTVDMQRGKIAYAKGKKIIGTGKCFEFAEYGSALIGLVTDSEGVSRYGLVFEKCSVANIIFIASTDMGDIILQNNHIVSIGNGETIKLGDNHTTGGEVKACYNNNRLLIYFTDFSQTETKLRYFIGKDNEL